MKDKTKAMHNVETKESSNENNGANVWEEDTTVCSSLTRCILPKMLAEGRPHTRYLFGDNMTNIARDDERPTHNESASEDDDDSDDDDDDDGNNFGSQSENAARKLHRAATKQKGNRILKARHLLHVHARNALQEFLRDSSTSISQLTSATENPIFLMMRLVRVRQIEYEVQNLYVEAKQCAAVARSLEQLVMQAKPLSTILLEILESLRARKDRANSLNLSFRHADRLQLQFAEYDKWLLKKFKSYSHCIDLVRYGNHMTQNRLLITPFANRKGIKLTKSNLVRSVHEKVNQICTVFNKYGQVS